MIVLLAFITAHPEKRESLLEAMLENLPMVLAEDGCIEYRPTIDREGSSRIQTLAGPDTVVVVEKWRDRDALKAHMNAAHMVRYAEKVAPLVSTRQIFMLSEAEKTGLSEC